MRKRLFVLFVVLILVTSLVFLFIYDRNVLEEEKANNKIKNRQEQITEDEEFNQENEILGSLIIAKINLNAQVKEGSSKEVLED